MPSKNRIKHYSPGGTYHIYNRGIDGREIFGDEEDYSQFVSVLERYLGEQVQTKESIYKKERPYLALHRQHMMLAEEVELLAICLMPDHFHMLIWQKNLDGMKKLMRRVITNYVMYYNNKYKRSGTLFENVYRAVTVEPGEQGVLVSKYIHTNPMTRQVKRFGLVETSSGSNPEYYMYSSYANYLEKNNSGINPGIIKTEKIRSWFHQSKWSDRGKSYQKFVEEPVANWNEVLGGLVIEKL